MSITRISIFGHYNLIHDFLTSSITIVIRLRVEIGKIHHDTVSIRLIESWILAITFLISNFKDQVRRQISEVCHRFNITIEINECLVLFDCQSTIIILNSLCHNIIHIVPLTNISMPSRDICNRFHQSTQINDLRLWAVHLHHITRAQDLSSTITTISYNNKALLVMAGRSLPILYV